MSCITAPLNSRFPHRNTNRRAPAADGYALLALMIMVTVMLISLTAALPNIYQEGQREREEEAIFRGEQYARAIYLFHHAAGRYPTSVKELLNTNGVHYLRQAYRDPLSPNGRWRFIHATAGGIVIDSWNQPLTPPNAQNTGTSAFSNQGVSENNQNTGENTSTGQNASQNSQKKPKHPPSSCDSSKDSSSSSQTSALMGAFIVGVAPCNDRQSIRIYGQNHEDHYDEWEFMGSDYAAIGLPASPKAPFGSSSQPATTSQPGFSNSPQSSSSPQGPSGFNQPGQSSGNPAPGP